MDLQIWIEYSRTTNIDPNTQHSKFKPESGVCILLPMIVSSVIDNWTDKGSY